MRLIIFISIMALATPGLFAADAKEEPKCPFARFEKATFTGSASFCMSACLACVSYMVATNTNDEGHDSDYLEYISKGLLVPTVGCFIDGCRRCFKALWTNTPHEHED